MDDPTGVGLLQGQRELADQGGRRRPRPPRRDVPGAGNRATARLVRPGWRWWEAASVFTVLATIFTVSLKLESGGMVPPLSRKPFLLADL
jgi:hypothetical protein